MQAALYSETSPGASVKAVHVAYKRARGIKVNPYKIPFLTRFVFKFSSDLTFIFRGEDLEIILKCHALMVTILHSLMKCT